MCRVFSCVVGRGCLLWPVRSLGKTLLAFALLCSVLQGQICFLRRGSKNTQKNCTKKDLHNPDNHDGVITHLEPDILECEVKWALGSITTNKASEVMKFQLSYFISYKRCCESAALNMPANLENSAVATGLERVSFHSNPKERQSQRMLKLLHNCIHLTH